MHRAWLAALQKSGERRCLLLTGAESWCQQQARHYWSTGSLWIGEGPAECQPIPASKALQWLGQEMPTLVYNGFSGLHPDMLGASSGLIQAGGLLILLMPELDRWAQFADPDYQRYVAEPHLAAQCHAGFLLRMQTLLLASPAVWHQSESGQQRLTTQPSEVGWQRPCNETTCMTLNAEQALAVQAIRHCALGHPHRPLVLTADRGRGKSAALGLAVRQLLHEIGPAPRRILITAPSLATLTTFWRHVGIPADQPLPTYYKGEAGEVQFLSPDVLLDEEHSADLLLVDEAAAIATGILAQWLQRYSRIVFATTQHGYEGSGQGFAIRMHKLLQQQTPGWQAHQLIQPIRWAPTDPLEPLLDQILLLGQDGPAPSPQTKYQLHWQNQAELAKDEPLLRQVFGLLVQAHYQTRPSDLRTLLDSPGLQILIAMAEQQVCGVLLTIQEGEIQPELAHDISQGKRRPRGHLLPQTLLAHAGYTKAGQYRYLRVMRIAVHPACQRQGIGQDLLQALDIQARHLGCDFIGTAFAATSELIPFWSRHGLKPVRLGLSRETASGTFSLIMLKALNQDLLPQVVVWQQAFLQSLPTYLPRQWQTLEPEIVSLLAQEAQPERPLSPQDWLDLQSLATGLRSLDHALPALQRWLQTHPEQWRRLPKPEQALLIRWIWQNQDKNRIAQQLGLKGQKAFALKVRQILQSLTW